MRPSLPKLLAKIGETECFYVIVEPFCRAVAIRVAYRNIWPASLPAPLFSFDYEMPVL